MNELLDSKYFRGLLVRFVFFGIMCIGVLNETESSVTTYFLLILYLVIEAIALAIKKIRNDIKELHKRIEDMEKQK